MAQETKYLDAFEIIGDDVEFDYFDYRNEEEFVLTPAIIRAGYKVKGGWFTSDGDSFGPLVRAVRAVNQAGENVTITYC